MKDQRKYNSLEGCNMGFLRDDTRTNHQVLFEEGFFDVTTQVRLYSTQLFLAKIAVVFSDLLHKRSRSVATDGDRHYGFKR